MRSVLVDTAALEGKQNAFFAAKNVSVVTGLLVGRMTAGVLCAHPAVLPSSFLARHACLVFLVTPDDPDECPADPGKDHIVALIETPDMDGGGYSRVCVCVCLCYVVRVWCSYYCDDARIFS
jgi:hypothetical protein